MKRSAHRGETADSAESARLDTYIADAPVFAQPILVHLRKLVHQASPEVTEEIKWRQPFFLHRGSLLCYMAAFKQHCSFGFWGSEMAAVLKQDGRGGNDDARGSRGAFGRILTKEDLPSDEVMLGYLRRAIAFAETVDAKPAKVRRHKPEVEPTPEFIAAMAKIPGATEGFALLTPGGRRDYVHWIANAKRAETRSRRMQTSVQWIAEGKSVNWKYEKC